MNREIKFRGKCLVDIGNIKKGDWVYGGISYDTDRVWIDMPYYGQILVDKDTVGQYTGLHDKNGKEIYEGDIVGDNKIKWIVKWNKNRMGFSLYPTTEQLYDEMPINIENKLGFKILGNIYDNPELLGGEDE